MKKVISVSLVFLISIKFSLGQCAMCRAVLQSGENQDVAEGINDGIMFLMAIPYILVSVIGYIVYKTYKNSSKSKKV